MLFNRLGLYLVSTIMGTIGLVMLLLVGLDLIFSLVNELREVGTGDYNFWRAALYILMNLPQRMYQMFPMSALVGTLMGLGVLASHSELVVMQAAGISIRKITTTIVFIAMILGCVLWVVGEAVGPTLDRMATDMKSGALSGGQTIKTSHGTWLRDGDDFVHVRKMFVGGHLEGITRYQFDENLRLKKAIYASYGDYIHDHWILKDIHETIFENNQIHQLSAEQQRWDSVLSPSLLSVAAEKDIDKLSIVGLRHTIEYRRLNGLDSKPFELAFWDKMVQPLSVAVMMFLAVPFVFGPLRSATMGLRLLTGILVGFSFHTFDEIFGHVALVYQIPPFVGAVMPPLVFMMIGMMMLRRVR